MLKAHALFIVIVIALILGIISSSLILLAYHYRIYSHENLLAKRLQLNAASGLHILLTDQNGFQTEETLDLYGKEVDSVQLKKISWGAFETGLVRAFSGRHQVNRAAQLGYTPDSAFAVYLPDQRLPLSLAGNTLIKGNCYLPEAGVKRAYVDGRTYTEATLINGQIRSSNPALPALAPALLSLLRKGPDQAAEKIHINEFTGTDTIERSFFEPTLFIYADSLLILDKTYRGNICIRARNEVIIRKDCHLKDVLIFAPLIRIQKGFTGNAQFFASDTILVDKDVRLNYPSVLALIPTQHKQPYLQISKGTVLKGMVIADAPDALTFPVVEIGTKTRLEGCIYVKGSLELRGEVWGMVSCNRFRYTTPSALYENHLVDAVIDHTRLSDRFIGSVFFPGKQKQVVKWLE